MIIDTMTPEEMLREFERDNDELWRSVHTFVAKGGVNHLRKNVTFPAYVMREYTSTRGTRYLQVLKFRTKNEVFNVAPTEHHCALLNTKEGLSLIARVYDSSIDGLTTLLFRPHVFKRYKERMGFKQDGIDLIKTYYKRNPDMVVHNDYKHKEGDMERDLMVTIRDGAIFCSKNKDDTGYTINTFIANDTMQDGYKSKFNKQHNERLESDLKAWKGILPEEILVYNKRKE